MSRTRKASKASGNDPRQKLTGDFVTALQADWQLHGQDIIESLRTQNPVKYAEIVLPPGRAGGGAGARRLQPVSDPIGHWQEAPGASWRARRRND